MTKCLLIRLVLCLVCWIIMGKVWKAKASLFTATRVLSCMCMCVWPNDLYAIYKVYNLHTRRASNRCRYKVLLIEHWKFSFQTTHHQASMLFLSMKRKVCHCQTLSHKINNERQRVPSKVLPEAVITMPFTTLIKPQLTILHQLQLHKRAKSLRARENVCQY